MTRHLCRNLAALTLTAAILAAVFVLAGAAGLALMGGAHEACVEGVGECE